jgi:DNA-binding NtrC family response regulator
MDGNETLREIKRQYPMTEVIMLTGHATIESAIDGLKGGACDYMMKPADVEEIVTKVEEAYHRRQGLEEKIRVASLRKLGSSPETILKECE